MLKRTTTIKISAISEKGFTIIEIMVVAAIIGILVTLAIPRVMSSRRLGNEAAAMASLKTICNVSQLYHTNIGAYPQTLSDLIEPQSNPPYIDTELASGEKHGYEFIYQFEDAGHFSVNANPVSPGITGSRYFYIDETGVIRSNQNEVADENDPIVS